LLAANRSRTSFSVHPAPVQGPDECRPDLMHAAIASAFSNKASPWLKRPVNRGDHRIGVLNLVQHCVAEHGIELFPERQGFSAHHMCIQPKCPRGLNLRSAGIDGDNFTPKLNQFFRERPVSAAQLRRFARLTNAFSKMLDNMKAALSLHFAWYNFCRVHSTLRITPAMEAGITSEVWSLSNLIS
jgi:hypothetical protein